MTILLKEKNSFSPIEQENKRENLSTRIFGNGEKMIILSGVYATNNLQLDKTATKNWSYHKMIEDGSTSIVALAWVEVDSFEKLSEIRESDIHIEEDIEKISFNFRDKLNTGYEVIGLDSNKARYALMKEGVLPWRHKRPEPWTELEPLLVLCNEQLKDSFPKYSTSFDLPDLGMCAIQNAKHTLLWCAKAIAEENEKLDFNYRHYRELTRIAVQTNERGVLVDKNELDLLIKQYDRQRALYENIVANNMPFDVRFNYLWVEWLEAHGVNTKTLNTKALREVLKEKYNITKDERKAVNAKIALSNTAGFRYREFKDRLSRDGRLRGGQKVQIEKTKGGRFQAAVRDVGFGLLPIKNWAQSQKLIEKDINDRTLHQLNESLFQAFKVEKHAVFVDFSWAEKLLLKNVKSSEYAEKAEQLRQDFYDYFIKPVENGLIFINGSRYMLDLDFEEYGKIYQKQFFMGNLKYREAFFGEAFTSNPLFWCAPVLDRLPDLPDLPEEAYL